MLRFSTRDKALVACASCLASAAFAMHSSTINATDARNGATLLSADTVLVPPPSSYLDLEATYSSPHSPGDLDGKLMEVQFPESFLEAVAAWSPFITLEDGVTILDDFVTNPNRAVIRVHLTGHASQDYIIIDDNGALEVTMALDIQN